MEQIEKMPAPAERADEAELNRLIEEAQTSPLFQAIIDWMDGVVVILNKQRQIVMASPNIAGVLGLEDAGQILGCRLGEAFRCVHSTEREDGCGASRACKHCGALNAILKAKKLNEPIETEYLISMADQSDESDLESRQTVKLRIRASKAVYKEWEFIVVLLQPSGPARSSFATDATIFSSESGWPGGVVPFVRIRKLGEGGMGDVFLVRGADGREYALKTIREEVVKFGTTVERFAREGKLAIAFSHPNIVKTYKAATTAGGLPYMVSEYCERGALNEWLRNNGPLPLDLALYWMSGVARALEYLWSEHRLVHRDIKPANLLVNRENQVKITDFGIALNIEQDEHRLTSFGQILGSVLYIAPEQIGGGQELDVRTDLYAMGATFFELVTGEPPFDGATPAAVLSSKLVKNTPEANTLRKGLPDSLNQCIDWLLKKKIEDRPQGPRELLERLGEIAAAEKIALDEVPAKYL